MQPVVELLVGIPSVVYGFIGLIVVVPFCERLSVVRDLGFWQEQLYFLL